MHPSIYREFDVSFSPSQDEGNEAGQPEPTLYVRLRERSSGEELVFKLFVDEGTTPERWIEEQVLRRFPLTAAARALRATYGMTQHMLRPGWEKSFGDRLYSALRQPGKLTHGPRFWCAYIPALPPVLYSAMTTRAIARISELPQPVELKTLVKTLHDAWLVVLTDGANLSLPLSGMQRLAMDLGGWDSRHLQAMSPLELSQLKEKAHFARLALGFLADEDWVRALTPCLDLNQPQ